MARVLVCTVGSSHQPILAAIKHHNPELTVFVCSDDDPVSGQSGSYTRVLSPGCICRSSFGKPPDLPNIPLQAGLQPGSFQTLTVPADNPVRAISIIRPVVQREICRVGPGNVAADYTGGTKSMTAALFFAAIHTPGVTLHNVTGPRSNLLKVEDGTERVRELRNAHTLLLPVRLEEVDRAWSRFSYGEAVGLLGELAMVEEAIAGRLYAASRGYEAWALGQYHRALSNLKTLSRWVPKDTLPALTLLAKPPASSERSDAHHIYDLLLGAERDASTGHYDVAILCLYRAFEAIAQWSLRWHHRIDTADAPGTNEVVHDVAHRGRDGKLKLGLEAAWTVLGGLDGPLAAVASDTARARLSFADLRNRSRFAHGTHAIDRGTYDEARAFLDARVVPAFMKVAFRGRAPWAQLPRSIDGFRDRGATTEGAHEPALPC